MKNRSLVLILILAAIPAWAFQSNPVTFRISNPLRTVEEIDRSRDLSMSKLEIATKRDLIHLRLFNSKKFFEMKNNQLENSPLLQSYLDEVDEAFWGFNRKISAKSKLDLYQDLMRGKPIDMAKKIAKQQLLLHIQKNWTQLRETIYNENNAESWEHGGRDFTLSNLNKSLVFVPQPSSKYQFKFGDSYVEIDKKTLKTGQVGLDVNSRLDANRLVPEANDIVPDDAEGQPHAGKSSAATNSSGDSAATPSPQSTATPSQTPAAAQGNGQMTAPPALDPNFNLNNF